eukprot:gene11020-12011_t
MKAAWIQWASLRIHPFEEGNGRVSRIISSITLYKLKLPPNVVKKEKRDFFFIALKAADKENDLGSLRQFLKDSLDATSTHLEGGEERRKEVLLIIRGSASTLDWGINLQEALAPFSYSYYSPDKNEIAYKFVNNLLRRCNITTPQLHS